MKLARTVWPLAVLLVQAGCDRNAPPPRHVSEGRIDPVIRMSELQPGPAAPVARVRNPYGGDERRIANGERLFNWYNCSGCHGALGGGGIGPPLRDATWIYGGEPQQIYRSIVEGRPEGMPSYGGRIPDDVAWQIIAYIESLGGTPSSEPRNGGSPTEAEGGSR